MEEPETTLEGDKTLVHPAATLTALKVNQPTDVILGLLTRTKELINAVAERSGVKAKDAKPVVAMLAILDEALADSRELNLPSLGRVMVRCYKQLPNRRMLVIKVLQSSGSWPTEAQDAGDTSD